MRAATASAPASCLHNQPASPAEAYRAAMDYILEHGLPISPSKASRLVRGQLRELDLSPAERDLRRYLLTYADPTGETAARNVDREASR